MMLSRSISSPMMIRADPWKSYERRVWEPYLRQNTVQVDAEQRKPAMDDKGCCMR